MLIIVRGILFVLIFGGIGCTSVPKESVELSVTVGRDLAEIHRAHNQLAKQYFGQIKHDINRFIDEVYRPFLVKNTIKKLNLFNRLQNPHPGDPDQLEFLNGFVKKMIQKIESYRQELLAPILGQEAKVIRGIDDSYIKVQNANAIVTGHLASLMKVKDAQSEILAKLGVEGLRESLINKTAALSDGIAKVVDKAREGEKDLDKMRETLEKAREQFERLLNVDLSGVQ